MPTNTPRFALPNIMVSQAHKEITHNEALSTIDGLLHASIMGSASTPPNLSEADAGQCWLVQTPATGVWLGKEDAITCWNGSGWRFFDPIPGMTVWDSQNNWELRFSSGGWLLPVGVPAPTGGTVVDSEVRTTLNALLSHLRNIGVLAN